MIIRISKFDNSIGINHIATDWELSTDPNFNTIIASEYNSTEFLNAWVNLFTVPIGMTYYYRYRRKLDTGNTIFYTDWVEGIPIVGKAENISLLFPDDVYIEHPTIYVNKEDILNTENDTFTIRCSEYRGTADGHAYTHWIITDDSENVIFHSLYDMTNKLSINIDKTNVSILDKKSIKITVIHGSGSGIESKPGNITINIDFTNYKLVSNIRKVIPYVDFPLVFVKKNNRLPMGITRVELYGDIRLPPVDVKIVSNPDTSVVTIPGCVLEPNSTYILKVYSTRMLESDTVTKYTLNTIDNDVIKPLDISYSYTKKLDIVYQEPNIKFIPGITTSEIYSGNIPMVLANDDRMFIFTYDRLSNRLKNTQIVMNGITIFNTIQSNILIKQLNPKRLLIDMLTNDNKPIFMVYDIVPELNTYTLINSKVRDNEIECLGKTNGFVQLSTNEILYIPTNSNMLTKYNIDTNELTELGPVPMNGLLNSTMFKIRGNRILIIGGNSDKGLIYNLNNGTYINSIGIPPEFRGKALKSITLSNGDTLITRIVDNANLEPSNNYLYYSIQDTKLSILTPMYSGNSFPSMTVTLATGELILGSVNENYTNIYLFN